MFSRLLLEPSLLLQTLALALSIFNLIAFLWLAFTVWLTGNRHSMIARVGIVGLGLSALFFYIHSLLISGPFSTKSGVVTTEFLWHLIWFPAIGVPYIWFAIGLYYASILHRKWHKRRPFLLTLSGLLGCGVLAMMIINQKTFTFTQTISFFADSDDLIHSNRDALSPLVLLPIFFLIYVAFCAIGPWFTPGRVWSLLKRIIDIITGTFHPTSLRTSLADAFWNDQTSIDQLEEPNLSWHLARPILMLAALLMLCLTMSLSALGIWSVIQWLQHLSLHINIETTTPKPLKTIPIALILLDIYATSCVAIIVLLIGYSIVRYGILIERPLARRGFFEQWRGIVIVATTLALFISLLVILTTSSLGALLLITSITIGIYALFTWSSYTIHDRYNALLGPFLRSTNVRHWLNTDLHKTEQSMETLFIHLCKNVLEVRCARLIVLAGPVRRSFNYRWPETHMPDESEEKMYSRTPKYPSNRSRNDDIHPYRNYRELATIHAYRIRLHTQDDPVICWVLPIYDELGLVAKFYLGSRQDDGIFTDEDMDLAHACGQRILDTLRDHEAMLAVAGLLRRRTVDVKLLGAQQRRVLHDEILPMLHLSLLHLESARSSNMHTNTERSDESINQSIKLISDAHRQLAGMMRAMSTGAPHRLERDGIMQAIHTMLAQDFSQSFDVVSWRVPDEVARNIDDLVPPAIAELIFAAVQEALRNAARHARGSDLHRRLTLNINASCNSLLEVIVSDDGVGIHSSNSSTTGTGGGLLTHSALLAIAGGNLSINTGPDQGVTVRITLPTDVLR